MNFSAAASSSPVVTPGRIFERSRFSVLTSTLPAAAMCSICSGVFLMIIRGASLERFLEAQRRQRGADVVVDLGLVTRAVEAAQQPALLVGVDAGRGLRVVDLEAPLDLLRGVALPLHEPRAVEVALFVVLGRVEVHVVDVLGV